MIPLYTGEHRNIFHQNVLNSFLSPRDFCEDLNLFGTSSFWITTFNQRNTSTISFHFPSCAMSRRNLSGPCAQTMLASLILPSKKTALEFLESSQEKQPKTAEGKQPSYSVYISFHAYLLSGFFIFVAGQLTMFWRQVHYKSVPIIVLWQVTSFYNRKL